MNTVILLAFGFCTMYQVHQFRRAGMNRFAQLYAISLVFMIAGIIWSWPEAVRIGTLSVAMAVLIMGSLQMRKRQKMNEKTGA